MGLDDANPEPSATLSRSAARRRASAVLIPLRRRPPRIGPAGAKSFDSEGRFRAFSSRRTLTNGIIEPRSMTKKFAKKRSLRLIEREIDLDMML
jgi:hypothetical protein